MPEIDRDLIAEADVLAMAEHIMMKYRAGQFLIHQGIRETEAELRKAALPFVPGESVVVWSGTGDDAWLGKFLEYDENDRPWVELDEGFRYPVLKPSTITRMGNGRAAV